MSERQVMPITGALWAILWRAVIYFPLGVAPLAIPFAGFTLAAWALGYGLEGKWVQATGCLAGLPAVVIAWRAYFRWVLSPPAQQIQLDGWNDL